jgi:hypothetical protein
LNRALRTKHLNIETCKQQLELFACLSVCSFVSLSSGVKCVAKVAKGESFLKKVDATKFLEEKSLLEDTKGLAVRPRVEQQTIKHINNFWSWLLFLPPWMSVVERDGGIPAARPRVEQQTAGNTHRVGCCSFLLCGCQW